MILSRREILTYIENKQLIIEPAISEDRIEQVSIDLTLGHKFTSFNPLPGTLDALRMDPTLWDSTELWINQELDTFRLNPGEFVLAQTLESVRIPSDLVGFVEGRSSFARIGITIHLTAPKIDPGFEGQITLELANLGASPVDLRAGVDRPAQLMLMKISSPLEDSELYGSSDSHVFQYQTDPIPRKPDDEDE